MKPSFALLQIQGVLASAPILPVVLLLRLGLHCVASENPCMHVCIQAPSPTVNLLESY